MHIVYDVVYAYDVVYDMQYAIVYNAVYHIVYDIVYDVHCQIYSCSLAAAAKCSTSRFQLPSAWTVKHPQHLFGILHQNHSRERPPIAPHPDVDLEKKQLWSSKHWHTSPPFIQNQTADQTHPRTPIGNDTGQPGTKYPATVDSGRGKRVYRIRYRIRVQWRSTCQ